MLATQHTRRANAQTLRLETSKPGTSSSLQVESLLPGNRESRNTVGVSQMMASPFGPGPWRRLGPQRFVVRRSCTHPVVPYQGIPTNIGCTVATMRRLAIYSHVDIFRISRLWWTRWKQCTSSQTDQLLYTAFNGISAALRCGVSFDRALGSGCKPRPDSESQRAKQQ